MHELHQQSREETAVSSSMLNRTLSACVAFLVLAPSIADASMCVGNKIRTPQLGETNSLIAVFALATNEAWVSGADASGGLLFYRCRAKTRPPQEVPRRMWDGEHK